MEIGVLRKRSKLISFCLIQFIGASLFAQSSTFNGWIVSNHEQKLSKNWSFLSDIQIRSSDRYRYVETVLLRPALEYQFSDKHQTAVGYTYLGNWEENNGNKKFELEHRAWEQYNLEIKAGNTEMNHRLRLEQRFLQSDKVFDFAQRLRYYIRWKIPLVNQKDFNKGPYVVLQNEVFLNIQNREAVNSRYFDQNRLYGSIGYRFSKKLEIDTGYLYRYQIEEEEQHDHILQLAIATSF